MPSSRRSAALLATLALAACGGCSTKAPGPPAAHGSASAGAVKTDRGVQGDTITLGVLTDLTGAFAAFGKDITNANLLYWEQRNASAKVCGKYTVKLDVKDTGYVPQQGVQLYSSLRNDILAMQQTLGAAVNTALEDSYTSDKIVNLPSAHARNLTDAPGNGVVGATTDVELVNGLGFALEQQKIKNGGKIGHIYLEGEYGANGLAGSKAFAKKHDMQVVEAKIKASDQDMTAQITNFKAQGVQAIVLTTAPGQTASAASVAAAQGLDVPIIGNSPVFAAGLLAGPAGPTLKSHLLVAAPNSTLDKQPQLLKDYLAAHPGATPTVGIVFGTAMSDIMRQVLDRACQNGDLTRSGVVKAKNELTDIDTGGLVVPLDYSIGTGKSPSRKSYILQPADVPGGVTAVTGPVESPDAAGLP